MAELKSFQILGREYGNNSLSITQLWAGLEYHAIIKHINILQQHTQHTSTGIKAIK